MRAPRQPGARHLQRRRLRDAPAARFRWIGARARAMLPPRLGADAFAALREQIPG